MKHLLDLTIDDLTAELAELGQPAFRAKQIATWVYTKGATDFAAMTDLPAGLRPELAARMAILTGHVAARADTTDEVTNLLIQWPDGERIETVLIPSSPRATACVSTQAGCAIGCT